MRPVSLHLRPSFSACHRLSACGHQSATRIRGRAAGWGVVLLLAFCAACAAPTPTALPTPIPTFHLTIATVPAGRERLEGWLARYQADHPTIAATIQPMSAARAQEALAQGQVDLALIDQPPAPIYRGVLTATELLREPLAVVVHPANPLHDLPSVAVGELLGGWITNWSQVGGADVPVQVYLLPDSAGEMIALAQTSAGRRLAPQAIVCSTSDSLQRAIAADPGGVGVLLYSSSQGQVFALSVDGTPPDSPSYPWQMPFFLAYGPATPKQALAFVGFARSKARGE